MSARGRGRGSRMSSPHIDPELELGTKTGFKTCPVHPFSLNRYHALDHR